MHNMVWRVKNGRIRAGIGGVLRAGTGAIMGRSGFYYILFFFLVLIHLPRFTSARKIAAKGLSSPIRVVKALPPLENKCSHTMRTSKTSHSPAA